MTNGIKMDCYQEMLAKKVGRSTALKLTTRNEHGFALATSTGVSLGDNIPARKVKRIKGAGFYRHQNGKFFRDWYGPGL